MGWAVVRIFKRSTLGKVAAQRGGNAVVELAGAEY